MVGKWTGADRATLDSILDQLIPPNTARMIPGAGQLGVAEFLADVAAQDATLHDAVTALLQSASTQPGEVTTEHVRQLESELPTQFKLLLMHTYKGYYSRPDMRAKSGVGAHPVHPAGYLVRSESAEFLLALSAPVRKRGPCYRDPGVKID